MRLDTEECAYPVGFMCERLGVSKSGYYDWLSPLILRRLSGATN